MDKKEINEAKDAAQQVLNLLDEVEKSLRSAKNWGIYDLLGGGFLSSLVKHRRIDQAESLLKRVHSGLLKLQKELQDVNLSIDSTVGISGFQRFLDIAFDNVLSDWMTQSRINESMNEVLRVKSEILEVINTLDRLNDKNIF